MVVIQPIAPPDPHAGRRIGRYPSLRLQRVSDTRCMFAATEGLSLVVGSVVSVSQTTPDSVSLVGDAADDIAVVPSLDELVEHLRAEFGERFVHLERLAPRPARFGELDEPISGEVAARLRAQSQLGELKLWSHQAEAINRIRRGESTVIATGTASGKSLCYTVPIAEAIAAPMTRSTALAIYPTKALAQDQLRALTRLDLPNMTAAAFDGDCSTEERTWVRNNSNVVLTNPEMLHNAMLPAHRRWSDFFSALDYVVLDELHVFRGVFGSHVAQVLRRLQRVCEHYGSQPTFVFTSATIGQPEVLATTLCGHQVDPVVDDGSPTGERLFLLWNPTARDGDGLRSTAAIETASLMARLVGDGYRSMAFCRSRRGTEMVAAETQARLAPELRNQVLPYRGGYLVDERREIETDFFEGNLRGVVTTSALELGVNVGEIDACVLNGFPGTVASMWQQAGRSGRQQRQSLTTLIAGADQLDQWIMSHPHELFARPPEPAVANPHNPEIRDPHLVCAAFELPLTHDDERWWGDGLADGVRAMVHADRLAIRRRRGEPAAVWGGGRWPASSIGLRSTNSSTFQIRTEDDDLIGTVDASRAFSQVHTGARYLHRGRNFVVDHLDLERKRAIVEAEDEDLYTQAKSTTDIRILETDAHVPVGRVRLSLGSVEVAEQVTGYQLRDGRTRELLATEALDLPASYLTTRAFWYSIPLDVLEAANISDEEGPGALHAAEHAGIGILPLFALCDRWDVGGVSTMWLSETGGPTIVIYDAFPGGIGVAELGFDAAERHLASTLEVLHGCSCTDGCPSCVQSPKCGNLNEPLDKAAAIRLIEAILN